MILAKSLQITYDDYIAIEDMSINVNKGEIISIIGPNGSGKSTLLRTIGRIHSQSRGIVYLDGLDMKKMKSKKIAQKMSMLFQHNSIPPDMTIEEFVGRGRMPHKSLFSSLSENDKKIISWALEETKTDKYKNRAISCLSGGERQRVFIAMALAQNPEVLLLDEPTTYLDICHQFEILELLKKINRRLGITIVMVLHDLNQASIYSDRIALLESGKLVDIGKPGEILTKEMMNNIYGINVKIEKEEQTGKPFFIPVYCAKEYSDE